MLNPELPSWRPRSYQEQGIKLCIGQACAGLLLRPGMGKTTIIYAVVKILRGEGMIRRTLVVVPIKPMLNVWPRQCKAWAEFADLRVNVCYGKGRAEQLRDPDADIYCINPEGLEWIMRDPKLVQYVKDNFDVLVIDESIKFKNTQTQRFKRIRQFVKYFKRRYILTGSFTPRGLLDLFGQVYILDEGAALGGYVSHYKTNYFHATDRMGYNLVPNVGAPEIIAAKIAPLVLVMEREGNIELPELLPPNDIYVDLPATVRPLYDSMEDELVALVESGTVVAANAAVASSKCRQIANGFIFNNDHTWKELHTAKIEALEELIEELSGEALLVVYEFNPDLDQLQKAFPHGKLLTSSNPRSDDLQIQAFKSGFTQLAFGQFNSISLGIDGLQNSCSNLAMFGLTWKLQDYTQTIDRIWRTGNKSKYVSVHRIIARNTVDQRVARLLASRDATQTAFLDMLSNLRNT